MFFSILSFLFYVFLIIFFRKEKPIIFIMKSKSFGLVQFRIDAIFAFHQVFLVENKWTQSFCHDYYTIVVLEFVVYLVSYCNQLQATSAFW